MKIFLVSLFLLSACANADTFFVAEMTSKETSSADRHTTQQLIRFAIPLSGDHSVVDSADGAQWVLTPSLLKLGDAYILNLEKRGQKSGAKFSASMKAASMSDMDTTANRLTKAVILERKVAETADVTNITDQETKMNMNRYEATRQWVLGIGPGWTSNLKSSGGGFSFLLGYEWGIDPDFSIDASYLTNSGKGNDDSRFSDFSLGGTYYLSRTKNSPMIGARIGYTSTELNDGCSFFCSTISDVDKSNGWSAGVHGGYKFFRTSTVNVSTTLRYNYVFDKGIHGNADLTSLVVSFHY